MKKIRHFWDKASDCNLQMFDFALKIEAPRAKIKCFTRHMEVELCMKAASTRYRQLDWDMHPSWVKTSRFYSPQHIYIINISTALTLPQADFKKYFCLAWGLGKWPKVRFRACHQFMISLKIEQCFVWRGKRCSELVTLCFMPLIFEFSLLNSKP